MSEADKWYIFSNEKLINLGNNNKKFSKIEAKLIDILQSKKRNTINRAGYIQKELGKKFHIFYLPFFDFNSIVCRPSLNILQIIFYESAKLLLVLGMVYILILISRYFIINPIKQLAEKMGYIKNKDEKELEYIENKIEEIQNINLTLQNKILSLRNYQKQKRIKEFITGITEHLDISLLNEISEIFKVDRYRVIIMEVFDIESVENIFDKFNLSKEHIFKIFFRRSKM